MPGDGPARISSGGDEEPFGEERLNHRAGTIPRADDSSTSRYPRGSRRAAAIERARVSRVGRRMDVYLAVARVVTRRVSPGVR